DTAIFGRDHNPSSHWLYRCNGSLPSTKKFQIRAEGAMVVELRSTHAHTVFPGSAYAGDDEGNFVGESIRWEKDVTPKEIDGGQLSRALAMLAAAAVLLQHWQSGMRDDLATALTGLLVRAKWEPQTIDDFVGVIAREANDEEWRDRQKALKL